MAGLVDYDSDSSSGSETAAAPAATAALVLPSVADLLDGGGAAVDPEFLTKKADGVDYKAMSSDLRARAAEETAAADAATAAVSGHKRPRPEASTTNSATAPSTDAAAPASKRKKEEAAGAAAAAGKDEKRVDFKERSKHQRLTGQSGIGSDFRVWRTDEEMALRQQIDS